MGREEGALRAGVPFVVEGCKAAILMLFMPIRDGGRILRLAGQDAEIPKTGYSRRRLVVNEVVFL